MSASEQKQQHFIPIGYSKNFGNEEGYIFVKDLWEDRTFPARPSKVLKERYLYRQPVHAQGRFDNIIEDFFSRNVESLWTPLFEKIEKKSDLNGKDWYELIQFMISMRVRVPNHLKAIIEVLRLSVERATELVEPTPIDELNSIFLERYPDHQGAIRTIDLIRADIISINIDPHRAITSLGNIVQNLEIFRILPNKPNIICNKTDLDFISSDNPLMYHVNHGFELEPYSFSYKDPVEMIFPISSKLALLMRVPDVQNEQYQNIFSKNDVKRINDKAVKYADRYIFSNKASDLIVPDNYKKIAPVPQLRGSLFDNGNAFSIKYKFGNVLTRRNTWKYEFENNSPK